ncbi:hypothetical protein J6590_034276 [Homalodisca vitripennis]|nr:hypothetical protein J6590_034276 [Homalodisca vitripennis]
MDSTDNYKALVFFFVRNYWSSKYGKIDRLNTGRMINCLFYILIVSIEKNPYYSLLSDETAILFEQGSWDEVYRVAAGELGLVKRWLDKNILTLNISKTKRMPISLHSAGEPPVDMTLVLNSCGDTNSGSCDCRVLQRVNQYKYLGVIMDSKLK